MSIRPVDYLSMAVGKKRKPWIFSKASKPRLKANNFEQKSNCCESQRWTNVAATLVTTHLD